MPAFSSIVAGTQHLSDPETVEIAPGVSITFRMRPLAPFETIAVLSAARGEAKAQGVDDPDAGEPIYELAREIHTLAFGLVDADSKSDDPKPFFDGGAAQVRGSKLLTNDAIGYLFALWEHWYETVSLQKGELNEIEYNRVMQEVGVGNARPFLRLRQGARWNFTRTTVARLLNLRLSKSDSFSGREATSPSLARSTEAEDLPDPAEATPDPAD